MELQVWSFDEPFLNLPTQWTSFLLLFLRSERFELCLWSKLWRFDFQFYTTLADKVWSWNIANSPLRKNQSINLILDCYKYFHLVNPSLCWILSISSWIYLEWRQNVLSISLTLVLMAPSTSACKVQIFVLWNHFFLSTFMDYRFHLEWADLLSLSHLSISESLFFFYLSI